LDNLRFDFLFITLTDTLSRVCIHPMFVRWVISISSCGGSLDMFVLHIPYFHDLITLCATRTVLSDCGLEARTFPVKNRIYEDRY